MFAKTIIDSDAFLDMPTSSRLLYYDLGMRADDDGFVNSPKKTMRVSGASEDDMKLLITKKFIIPFESGIIVIKHWKINNLIRSDRYNETKYKQEKLLLDHDENGSYRLTSGIPCDNQLVDQRLTQVRLGKVSLGKLSIEEDIVGQKEFAQVVEYLNQKTGKKFRLTEATKKLINARLKEKFLIDDFYRVIDNQCSKWLKDEKMIDYLRPQTLFGTKFESYLNAIKKKKFDIMDL